MDINELKKQFKQQKLRHRPSQFLMIEEVYTAVQAKKILCIEAPTGTGKTLSYLLGTYHAKAEKQKILISTATIALQEQLIKKDLPLLEQLLNTKIRFTLAKGRQNYLCLAKLKQDEQTDLFNKNIPNEILNQVENLFWDGDRETLNQPMTSQTWNALTTDSAGCAGKHCEHYDQCFFYKARNKVHSAEIIVTNHSLLLSDLSLGGGAVLPEPENNIYILDECHHLPHRSLSHFSSESSLVSAIEWINQINFSVQRAINEKFIKDSWQTKINQLTKILVAQIKSLKYFLEANPGKFNEQIWRVLEIDIESFEPVYHLAQCSKELITHLEAITQLLETELDLKNTTKDNKNLNQLVKSHGQIKFLIGRATQFHTTWRLFSTPRQPKEAPTARWFEKIVGAEQEDYTCFCAPINVSQQLQNFFWHKIKHGAVLCSATIRSLGNFDHFLKKTGLHLQQGVKTQSMPVIFNYQNSIIFVPTMQYEPTGTNQQKHREEAISLLPSLILPNSGTLVLFTAKSAMEDTYHQLPPDLAFDILMQGKKNKSQLIETHKQRISAGNRSIIFGLASFAEGIDLPAEFCQHVIIHKLPFTVPSTPIELTRSEWIAHHQLNPFVLATLPETSIKLTQYIGRLIRQEEDKGIVTILDRRLYSKGYGKQLINNMPAFRMMINCSIEQLKQEPTATTLFQSQKVKT